MSAGRKGLLIGVNRVRVTRIARATAEGAGQGLPGPSFDFEEALVLTRGMVDKLFAELGMREVCRRREERKALLLTKAFKKRSPLALTGKHSRLSSISHDVIDIKIV